MAIQDDISVSAAGDIRYTGTTTNYTVIAFHRWLQDLADDASSSGDDLLDITDDTPSERSTDNIITLYAPYNIDDTLAQHLYDGSIIQTGGDEIYDGIVNFGIAGIHIEVLQAGALITPNFWTTGLNADANAGISHRFMVKTRTGGADVDGRRLLGMAREFGYTYSEFPINGTARGNNVLALTHAVDLNNQTATSAVSGWVEITNTEGYRPIDIQADGAPEFFYSEWNRDVYSINQFFENMKYRTRRGTSETLYGIDGDLFRGITHQVALTPGTGLWVEPEGLSWGTGATAGTGQLLAVDDTDAIASSTLWMQILTGVPPNANLITGAGGATGTAGTVTDRTLSQPFIGASTGSAIIGAYGVGIESTDLTAADKVFDLTNTNIPVPNYVTFTVYGLVNSEDRVLVGPESGGIIDISQLTASGAYVGAEATFTVNEVIPGDTPATGTIRIWNGDTYSRVTYTGWSVSDFTGCTGVPACSDLDNVWISYIDTVAGGTSASFTCVYQSLRNLFIRVRDGGGTPIKTFETTGTLGSAGGSSTAIRTSDA
jgi:hypothetical protein